MTASNILLLLVIIMQVTVIVSNGQISVGENRHLGEWNFCTAIDYK